MRRALKLAYCGLSAAFLIYCAAVQFNDPDPVRWVLAYGTGAAFAAATIRIRWPAPVGVGLSLLCAIFGLGLYLASAPVTDWFDDEVGREVMGLSLLALITFGLVWARPEEK